MGSKTKTTTTTIVSADIKIDAPKLDVWRVLADLEKVQDYDPWVVKSFYLSEAREGVGASRQCDLPGGNYVRERVISWREGDGYVLEIDEDGSDDRTLDQQAEFALEETDGATRVAMTYRYALKPDVSAAAAEEMKQGGQELLNEVLAGLKRLVEAGERVTMSPQ